jgi:hypothetical protein
VLACLLAFPDEQFYNFFNVVPALIFPRFISSYICRPVTIHTDGWLSGDRAITSSGKIFYLCSKITHHLSKSFHSFVRGHFKESLPYPTRQAEGTSLLSLGSWG